MWSNSIWTDMKVLIIEDEKTIGRKIERMLKDIDHDIEICAMLESISDILKYFSNDSTIPDVIFSDIRLKDGIVFDALQRLELNSHIVFITAYDEYAIKAFKYNGIDYILKPPTRESLEFALNRSAQLCKSNIRANMISIKDNVKYIRRLICASKGGTCKIINVEDIAFLSIRYGGVRLATFDNQKFEIDETMDSLENKLNPSVFFRANRQYIININCIDCVTNLWNRKLKINMLDYITCDEEILVSKEKITKFRDWLTR